MALTPLYLQGKYLFQPFYELKRHTGVNHHAVMVWKKLYVGVARDRWCNQRAARYLKGRNMITMQGLPGITRGIGVDQGNRVHHGIFSVISVEIIEHHAEIQGADLAVPVPLVDALPAVFKCLWLYAVLDGQ